MKPATTCLILGAGASKPYGYPLGEELAQAVIREGQIPKSYRADTEERRLQVSDWSATG